MFMKRYDFAEIGGGFSISSKIYLPNSVDSKVSSYLTAGPKPDEVSSGGVKRSIHESPGRSGQEPAGCRGDCPGLHRHNGS